MQQLQRVLNAIWLTRDQELSCASLDSELLAAYVDLELAGHNPASRMPDVYRHLRLCPDCRHDYQAILTTLRLRQKGEWVEPGSTPSWDLSFLPADAREPAWSRMAGRVRHYGMQLPVLMLHELERAGTLPTGLQLRPASAAAPKMRGPEADTPIVAFRLTDAEERFAVDLRFRRAGQDVVWIGVRPLDVQSEDPLPGATVGLHDGDGRLLEMRTVPAAGAVQLRDVPINRAFVLRIEYDERVWEIPFSLHLETSGEGDD